MQQKINLEGTVKATGATTLGYLLTSSVVGSIQNIAAHPLTYKMHPIDELSYVWHFAANHGEQALYLIGASAIVGLVYDVWKMRTASRN